MQFACIGVKLNNRNHTTCTSNLNETKSVILVDKGACVNADTIVYQYDLYNHRLNTKIINMFQRRVWFLHSGEGVSFTSERWSEGRFRRSVYCGGSSTRSVSSSCTLGSSASVCRMNRGALFRIEPLGERVSDIND